MELGEWLGQLAQGPVEPKEQQAAVWVTAHRDQFEEARAVRGIHAKWKEIEQERERVNAAAPKSRA